MTTFGGIRACPPRTRDIPLSIVAPEGESPKLADTRPRALAFYLPQFHPIPENDEWWGKGFTEWANVTRAKPLFPGHYQPHLPGELGFYDLRVPEVREAQADLARDHGISGFVYYHYWFNGRRLLERPFNEVLASGSPDLPFALCWCNEAWTRNWDSYSGELLVPQHYSDEDDLEHIRWLLGAFADERYIKVDGRPLMLIYRPALLPEPRRMTDVWRAEAQRAGFPDLLLCWVESWGYPPGGPEAFGLDATVGFMPQAGHRVYAPFESHRDHRIIDYRTAYEAELARPEPPWQRFPTVMVSWDNTARRRHGATIYEGASPAAYRRWLEGTVASVRDVREEENLIFVMAWNEWAEGNHLEPDQRYGRGYLEATRAVLLGEPPSARRARLTTEAHDTQGGRQEALLDEHSAHEPVPAPDTPEAHALELLRHLTIDTSQEVVQLGEPSPSVTAALALAQRPQRHLALEDVLGELASTEEALNTELLDGELGASENVGAILLLGRLEHLSEPQLLLAKLAGWSLKHGEPLLVLTVPNMGHFDLGLDLLCGRWSPAEAGAPMAESRRFYTEPVLKRLLESCGWHVVGRDDVSSIRWSGHADGSSVIDELPEALVGALRVLSDAYNPQWAVTHFVWALAPRPVKQAPESFSQAVMADQPDEEPSRAVSRVQAVQAYLESVGLVASEVNRRGAEELRRRGRPARTDLSSSLPGWKRGVLALVYRNPVSAAAFRRIYGWVR